MLIVGAGPASHSGASPQAIAPAMTIDIGEKECTLGFLLADSRGKAKGLTARHCGDKGAVVRTTTGAPVGVVEKVSAAPADIAMISIRAKDPVYAAVTGEGDVTGIISADTLRATRPVVCKKGSTTELTCGPLVEVADGYFTFIGEADHGDSGAPVYARTTDGSLMAAGILEGTQTGHSDRIMVTSLAPYVAKWRLSIAE